MSLKELEPLLPRRAADQDKARWSFAEFFAGFWRIGFFAFGGSLGHFALLHDKYTRSDDGPSLPEAAFIELFALCIALPGPLGSKLASALGATFGGVFGAVLCFVVFSAPGALALACAGVWFHANTSQPDSGEFVRSIADHGIGLIAAAFGMVVIAAYRISVRTCATSKLDTLICVATTIVGVLVPPDIASVVFVFCMALGGLTVLLFDRITGEEDENGQRVGTEEVSEWQSGINSFTGAIFLTLFLVITAVLTLWRSTDPSVELFRSFWIVGWTVFGGGNVVIPFLLNLAVDSGWIDESVFMSGFGLVGCMPGPFYNIAPFIGGAMLSWRGALFAAVGILMPSLLLLVGVLPFWDKLRNITDVRVFLRGVNASAAGLVLTGVWMLMRRILVGPLSFAISISAAAAAISFKVKIPYIVLSSGFVGALLVTAGIGGPYR